MAARLIILLAACILQANAGKVSPPPAQEVNYLEEIQKHAQEFQKTFSEQFNGLVTSKNTEEFNKALKEGSDSVLQQVSALSASLQGALADANGKAKEALEAARQNLERTAEDLKRSHPEVEREAGALKDKIQAAVQNAVQHTQSLAKEVGANVEQTNQKLAPQLKQAYDEFVKQAGEVQKKLHEAATKQ